jgi:hypothetical protein
MTTGPVAALVATLRELVGQAEADWRRARLPPLSRDAPRPDPSAVHGARVLEAVGRELDAIGGQLRTLPLPDPARLVLRHGQAAPGRLGEADAAILAHGGFLLELLDPGRTAGTIDPDDLQRSVGFLRELAQRRAELLA